MDDTKYLFLKDSKEKKDIARSARKKVRHTGCTLPSDYLSAKQKSKMNGEVFSVNIKKPMKYTAFKLLPRDIQQEYLDFVASEFSCCQRDFAMDILGVCDNALHKYIVKVGLRSPWKKGKHCKLKKNKWAKFIAGQYASESDEKTHSETNDIPLEDTQDDAANTQKPVVEPEKTGVPAQIGCTLDEAVTEKPYATRMLFVELKDVRDWNDIVRAASAFSLPESNIVTIQVTESNHDGILKMDREEV